MSIPQKHQTVKIDDSFRLNLHFAIKIIKLSSFFQTNCHPTMQRAFKWNHPVYKILDQILNDSQI
ncbi:MAG: hypothetical protein ACD_2C00266G0005 [uncultured bacterium (gcode 4)]|uniref:Uncharacterized protein n=1 Tax=uncultured bacterium (gcode 4) TaxID=1234023 RepID=K2GF16_9BACT|nr:MAG: hypothetical protein ACD_2C00266G0005 [uncultured bacterium (gcode 4)]